MKLNFSIKIQSPKAKVWEVLWNDDTYRKWTSVFSEGSYAVSDWKEGGKILFLSPSGEGMYSTIEKMIPNEFMSFKHIGVVKNGKEQPLDEESKKWSGALENYTLKDAATPSSNPLVVTSPGLITELSVEIDVTEDHQSYFQKTFPKALEKVKELVENSEIQEGLENSSEKTASES